MGLVPDNLDDSRLSDQSGKEEASHASDLLLYKRRLADRQPADSRVRQTSYWRCPTQFIVSGSAGGSVCALVHTEAPRCFSFLVVQRATRQQTSNSILGHNPKPEHVQGSQSRSEAHP